MTITELMTIKSLRHTAWAAGCLAVLCLAAPAVSHEELKADHACRALVADPASAANLMRPPALRYRTPPLRVCVPEESDTWRVV